MGVEDIPAADIRPRQRAGFIAMFVSLARFKKCRYVPAPAYPGLAIPDAKVQRHWIRPTFLGSATISDTAKSTY